VGELEGDGVASALGCKVGSALVGSSEGTCVVGDALVGTREGAWVGSGVVGNTVGWFVGFALGCKVGSALVGSSVGACVDIGEGSAVGKTQTKPVKQVHVSTPSAPLML